jgi:hypothetical protein
MASATSDFHRGLIAVLERACAHAKELSNEEGGLPQEEVKRLKRVDGYLSVVVEPEVNWLRLLPGLHEEQEIAEELTRVREQAIASGELTSVASDDHPELAEVEYPTDALWDGVMEPMLRRYYERARSWNWDEALGHEALEAHIASRSKSLYDCRTIAPLDNFEGPDESVEIEAGLAVRPFTDTEREALWKDFGTDNNRTGSSSPDTRDLERWTHVIDYQWKLPEDSFFILSAEPGKEGVRQAMHALRLHLTGIPSFSIMWTRANPAPDPYSFANQAILGAPDSPAPDHGLPKARIEASDAKPLAKMLGAVRKGEEENRRLALALRRFESSFTRHQAEDILIDLWIGFEALLLPDGQSELSYRAALRIAQLVAGDGAQRRETFRQARESYRYRSQVVHGQVAQDDLDEVVSTTRELARKALRNWVLDPPAGGIDEIDESLFA